MAVGESPVVTVINPPKSVPDIDTVGDAPAPPLAAIVGDAPLPKRWLAVNPEKDNELPPVKPKEVGFSVDD